MSRTDYTAAEFRLGSAKIQLQYKYFAFLNAEKFKTEFLPTFLFAINIFFFVFKNVFTFGIRWIS